MTIDLEAAISQIVDAAVAVTEDRIKTLELLRRFAEFSMTKPGDEYAEIAGTIDSICDFLSMEWFGKYDD